MVQVPKVGPKLKSLVTAMEGGGFGGEDSRKLFEALCKTIDCAMYDMELPPIPNRDPSVVQDS